MSPNSSTASDGLELFSEPVMHIYGKRCTESPPANDDAVQTIAEPLCSINVSVKPEATPKSDSK